MIVRLIQKDDVSRIADDFKILEFSKLEDMFASYWFEHQEGAGVIWIAYDIQKDLYVGYVTLYKPFFELGISEIKDFDIVPFWYKQFL